MADLQATAAPDAFIRLNVRDIARRPEFDSFNRAYPDTGITNLTFIFIYKHERCLHRFLDFIVVLYISGL
jgi:hypothetical protein